MLVKVLVLAVLAYISAANYGAEAAFTCYTCNANTSCNSPVNTTNLGMAICSANDKCIKFSYNSPTKANETVTWRGCANNQTCEAWNKTYSQHNNPLTSCSICKEVNCNSATSFAMPLVAMVASLLAVKFVQ